MEEKGRSRKKKGAVINWKLPMILVAAVAVIAIGALAGYGYSKFLTEKHLTGNVTYEKHLADSFVLWEHEAGTDPTGAGDYTLGDATVATNEYHLTPGTTIQKDPYITITGKTDIPAFLYVEVVEGEMPALMTTNVFGESIPAETVTQSVDYDLASGWKKLDNVTGYNDGTVYVWCGEGGTDPLKIVPQVTNTNGTTAAVTDFNIAVLLDNEVTVLTHRPTGTWKLDFYGYLLQAEEGKTAAQIYTTYIK